MNIRIKYRGRHANWSVTVRHVDAAGNRIAEDTIARIPGNGAWLVEPDPEAGSLCGERIWELSHWEAAGPDGSLGEVLGTPDACPIEVEDGRVARVGDGHAARGHVLYAVYKPLPDAFRRFQELLVDAERDLDDCPVVGAIALDGQEIPVHWRGGLSFAFRYRGVVVDYDKPGIDDFVRSGYIDITDERAWAWIGEQTADWQQAYELLRDTAGVPSPFSDWDMGEAGEEDMEELDRLYEETQADWQDLPPRWDDPAGEGDAPREGYDGRNVPLVPDEGSLIVFPFSEWDMEGAYGTKPLDVMDDEGSPVDGIADAVDDPMGEEGR